MRTGRIVKYLVLPDVAVVAADVIIIPSFSLTFPSPQQPSMPEMRRKKRREGLELDVPMQLTYLFNAMLSLCCAVIVISVPMFTIV